MLQLIVDLWFGLGVAVSEAVSDGQEGVRHLLSNLLLHHLESGHVDEHGVVRRNLPPRSSSGVRQDEVQHGVRQGLREFLGRRVPLLTVGRRHPCGLVLNGAVNRYSTDTVLILKAEDTLRPEVVARRLEDLNKTPGKDVLAEVV